MNYPRTTPSFWPVLDLLGCAHDDDPVKCENYVLIGAVCLVRQVIYPPSEGQEHLRPGHRNHPHNLTRVELLQRSHTITAPRRNSSSAF
jgi:hypothetical protein